MLDALQPIPGLSRTDHDSASSPEGMLLGGRLHNRSLAQLRAHWTDNTPEWAAIVDNVRARPQHGEQTSVLQPRA